MPITTQYMALMFLFHLSVSHGILAYHLCRWISMFIDCYYNSLGSIGISRSELYGSLKSRLTNISQMPPSVRL